MSGGRKFAEFVEAREQALGRTAWPPTAAAIDPQDPVRTALVRARPSGMRRQMAYSTLGARLIRGK